jgi:hypothetical protein
LIEGEREAYVEVDVVVDDKGANGKDADECSKRHARDDTAATVSRKGRSFRCSERAAADGPRQAVVFSRVGVENRSQEK